jgi:spore germination cell wall hydrolase CwlJ-like protein
MLSLPSRTAAGWTAIGIALCLAVAIATLGLQNGAARWHWSTRSPATQAVPPKARSLAKLPARPEDVASQALEPLAREDARKLNAEIPFAEIHPQPARAFHFAGSATDRARAVDCLALAAMAEAGGGDAGQRAVIQVVLNRVRHPAFAKTVCGVVFQGSERTTGCQFTFTCDGSLARRYSDAAWSAARRRASEALDGKVYAPVGAATHYHTDWVHPVWSSELNKIARIDTHLFFRWPGYWGSRDAGRVAYRGGEPAIAKMAWVTSHAVANSDVTPADTPPARPGLPQRAIGEKVGIGQIVVAHPEGGAYLVQLARQPTPAAALSVGRRLCGGRGYCRVLGWVDRGAVPHGFPVPPTARAKLSFSYVLDASNAEYTYYDCNIFQGVARDSCMPSAPQ